MQKNMIWVKLQPVSWDFSRFFHFIFQGWSQNSTNLGQQGKMQTFLMSHFSKIIFTSIKLTFALQPIIMNSYFEFYLSYLLIFLLFYVCSLQKIIVQMYQPHNIISEHFKQLTSGLQSSTNYNSPQSSTLSSDKMIQNTTNNQNHAKNTLIEPEQQQNVKTTKSEPKDPSNRIQVLEKLQKQLKTKQKQNQQLHQQVAELKKQVQYLMKSLQKLMNKENYENVAIDVKSQRMLKAKEEDLIHANKQIQKLKQWLKQQKAQVYRIVECIKMKDMLIQNIENELKSLKQSKQKKRLTKQKVKLSQQEQLTKYKTKSRQLQYQVYDLTEQIDLLRNDNYLTKLKNQTYKIQENGEEYNLKDKTALQRMSETKGKMQTGFTHQGQLLTFLSSKITLLQTQIEKLLAKIAVYEMQNLSQVNK